MLYACSSSASIAGVVAPTRLACNRYRGTTSVSIFFIRTAPGSIPVIMSVPEESRSEILRTSCMYSGTAIPYLVGSTYHGSLETSIRPRPLHELLVVRHPGVQECLGFAFDQVLVDGPDIVGELELDVFVAEFLFEQQLRKVGVGNVLVPAQVAERETPSATEPAASTEGPYRQQQQRGLQQYLKRPNHPRLVRRVGRPFRTTASP